MEETHSQLFKRIKFTPDQRTCIVALWRDWQKQRRALDSQLQAACSHVEALPRPEEISDAFVAMVSSRCMEGAVGTQAAEAACRLQPRSLLGLCPVAQAAAQSAMQALTEVQDRDARLQVQIHSCTTCPQRNMWLPCHFCVSETTVAQHYYVVTNPIRCIACCAFGGV